MSVYIKSEREIELIRESCHILAKVHEAMTEVLKPGVSTLEIDRHAEELIRSFDCIPNFKNYDGFPGTVCTSVNDQVVHGIPSPDQILKEGDIISLDMGCIYKGYHSDAARTHAIGEITEEARLLIERTRQSFYEGIRFAQAGNHLHEISNAIGDYCESFGYGVVRDLVGHGVGIELHEDPQIPNFRQKSRGIRLRPGMVLAVEPMVNAGGWEVDWSEDKWTVTTRDHSLSAHYENTILITESGMPEILTLTDSEREEAASWL
jgi:methionyl aminopeptidase